MLNKHNFQTNFQKSFNASLVHVQHNALVEQMSAKHSMVTLINGSDLKPRLVNTSLVINGGAETIDAFPPQLWQTVKYALFTAAATGVDSLSSHGNATQVVITDYPHGVAKSRKGAGKGQN